MNTWSPELRQAANLVMGNPHPAALFWGSELTMLYNEAYRDEVAGRKHPELLGTGFQGPFAELWETVGPIFAECARTGHSVRKDNQMLPIERNGYLEETFFSWSFTPLYGGSSRILGFYNAPFETTQHQIASRRTQTLRRLGEKIALSRTIKEFWKAVLDGLDENHFDVPFALLYSVMETDDDGQSSAHSSSGSAMSLKSCIFEGSIAVPEGHPAALQQLDLKKSGEGFIPSFREAMRTREPTKLQTRDGTLPEILLEGLHWRGFEEPCREATIFPVRPTNGDSVMAFLLLGVNPRRAYDDEYKAFTGMLNRQLATSLASVMLFEDEIRRSKNAAEAAAMEQEQLTQQLQVQTSRLRRMTALSPLGMFYVSPQGVVLEANDRYFEMTGHKREDIWEMSFMDHLVESSKPTMEDGWHKLVVDRVPWSGELQLKKQWVDPSNLNAEPIETWVLATSQPEFASDGSLRSIMGSITDISHLKWAQGLQNRRIQEAEETRRQQNEFIDITSHEMRNPLSAILQCADDISSTLNDYQAKGITLPAAVVDNCIEAANTIALCVQHQKSIVDDILTISKLDSNLLLVTPVPVQPVAVAKRALKMFDPELQVKKIKMELVIGPTFQELKIDWLLLDPSRLLQVLINLMTNAIKFTQAMAERAITVTVNGFLRPPIPQTPGFQYIPPRNSNTTVGFDKDWGSGELLYLQFKVRDTGCGLTDDEKQVLFRRFSQASPRTHAQYGGSGLGLFISRQLTELHGGQIGVASQAGVGSTFGFYFTTRRPEQVPEVPARVLSPLERDLQRDGHLDQMVTLQREDQSSPGLEASLAALAIAPKIDPRELSILVVEDNLVNQKVLKKQLEKAGCTVSVASHGKEALVYLERTEFRKKGGKKLSVILMDLEMPEMDGLTCVRKIREMEAGEKIEKHVPVIAVTANVRQEQIRSAKKSGMVSSCSRSSFGWAFPPFPAALTFSCRTMLCQSPSVSRSYLARLRSC